MSKPSEEADLAALASACPLDLGSGGSVTVTQQTVDAHAATTGDAQWIHNDPERARRDSPFGGPVAQGFLLLALLTDLSADLDFPPLPTGSTLVNYGLDRVRFVRPVPVGAAVRLSAELAAVTPRGDGRVVLSVDCELRLPDGSVAVAATWLFMVVA